MERPDHLPMPEPRWPWAATPLRVTFVALVVWWFFSGSSALSFGLVSVLALANVLALLLAYELAIRDAPFGWIAASIFGVIGLSLGLYAAWWSIQPPPPSGPLLPAHDPMPTARCAPKIGPRDLVMAFGTNRAVGTGAGPFYPLKVDDCTVLALRRVGHGLMVDAFFTDWNNDIAFAVHDNVYEATMPLQLRPFRPDPHTLVVLDRFDKEVLYVRYLNSNAVRIRGRFLCGEHPQAIIHDDRTFKGGIRLNGVFLGLKPGRENACTTLHGDTPGITVTDTGDASAYTPRLDGHYGSSSQKRGHPLKI